MAVSELWGGALGWLPPEWLASRKMPGGERIKDSEEWDLFGTLD